MLLPVLLQKRANQLRDVFGFRLVLLVTKYSRLDAVHADRPLEHAIRDLCPRTRCKRHIAGNDLMPGPEWPPARYSVKFAVIESSVAEADQAFVAAAVVPSEFCRRERRRGLGEQTVGADRIS